MTRSVIYILPPFWVQTSCLAADQEAIMKTRLQIYRTELFSINQLWFGFQKHMEMLLSCGQRKE